MFVFVFARASTQVFSIMPNASSVRSDDRGVVLVFNAGSSSLKFQTFAVTDRAPQPQLRGQIGASSTARTWCAISRA